MQFHNSGNILPKCTGVVPRNVLTFLFKVLNQITGSRNILRIRLIVLDKNKGMKRDVEFYFLLVLWLY